MINDKLVSNRRLRLKQWIDAHFDGVPARFIDRIDINQGELSGLLREKSFGEKKARSIELKAGMPKGYLDSTNDDEALVENLADNEIIINQYHDAIGAMGEGLVLRGETGQITGWKVNKEWFNKNVPSNSGNKNVVVVTGFGDSMRGMFNSGDPLLVDVGVKTIDYDGVYFFRIGDEGFIKTLQRIPSKGIGVISENKKYETWYITPDMNFEVIGRVLKVWKSEDF